MKPEGKIPVDEAMNALRQIAKSRKAPANARASAARTLLELQGKLGRHSSKPRDQNKSLSSMSRAELVHELELLRAQLRSGDTLES